MKKLFSNFLDYYIRNDNSMEEDDNEKKEIIINNEDEDDIISKKNKSVLIINTKLVNDYNSLLNLENLVVEETKTSNLEPINNFIDIYKTNRDQSIQKIYNFIIEHWNNERISLSDQLSLFYLAVLLLDTYIISNYRQISQSIWNNLYLACIIVASSCLIRQLDDEITLDKFLATYNSITMKESTLLTNNEEILLSNTLTEKSQNEKLKKTLQKSSIINFIMTKPSSNNINNNNSTLQRKISDLSIELFKLSPTITLLPSFTQCFDIFFENYRIFSTLRLEIINKAIEILKKLFIQETSLLLTNKTSTICENIIYYILKTSYAFDFKETYSINIYPKEKLQAMLLKLI
jgi:hypothetical protein